MGEKLSSKSKTRIRQDWGAECRCRVTETKNNLKGNHDTLECDACGENQEHVLKFKMLMDEKNPMDDNEVP